MRQLAACALALLLGATASYAATNPATQTANTKATTTAATTEAAAQAKLKDHCEKQAMAKKLYGQQHDDYVKECQEGKKQH